MELLKSLFESADLPAEFKAKTTTLFEAAVDEKVKAEVANLAEGFQLKLEEARAQFLAESIRTVDSVIDESVLEWARENAVGLDSEIKGQIAESFLAGLKGVFEKADIELSGDTAGRELIKLQEQNSDLVKQATDAKAALTEAQNTLTRIAIKEIIAEVTAGLADTQAHRVGKLVESFEFKSAEDYRAKAALVVEAVTGAPLKQEARGTTPAGKELNGDGNSNSGDLATGYAPDSKGGKIGGVNNGKAVPAGASTVSDVVDTTAGAAGPEDGELVVKPTVPSATSAEGNKGLSVKENTLIESVAPHLNSDLVAETLKLFR